MIQLRTVLTSDATSQVVQEPDGTLSHDALFPDKPWQTTALDSRNANVQAMRELLYSEKATPEERALAVPVAKSLAEGKVPAAGDVTRMEQAKVNRPQAEPVEPKNTQEEN